MKKTIFYERAQRVSKILFCHSKIKFISSRHRVISSIYTVADPGEGPGGTEPPPPYSPYFLDQTEAWRTEKFLWETFSPPHPTGPPLFEGLDPLLLCLISLVHSKNQAANQMTYNDVIRLPIVWIVGALATVHQLCRENYRKSVRPNCSRKLGIWI